MTTIFSTNKTLKNRFSERILGMEALESRELLSVNPLGIDNYAPDFVQTNAAQDFQTEAGFNGIFLDFEEVTHTKMKMTIKTWGGYGLSGKTYYLQYKNINDADNWQSNATPLVVATDSTYFLNIELTGLDPGTTYEFRLNTNQSDSLDNAIGTAVPFTDTQATVPTPKISRTSFDDSTHTLTINFSGLINNTEYTLAATDVTWGAGVTSDKFATVGSTAEIKVIKSSGSFTADEKFTFTLKEGSGDPIKDYEITLLDVTPGEITVTGGTTVTGLTSNAATITVPKVKNAKTYNITVGDLPPITGSTKNQITVSGLVPQTEYEIKVTVKDKDGNILKLDGTKDSTAADLSLGSFTTWAADNAADVKNPAISGGIAATYAATGKDYDGKTIANAGIKVTWKAPANYTGDYTVQIQRVKADGTVDSTVTFDDKYIPAGFKTEAFITPKTGSVTKDAYYKIKIVAGSDLTGTSPAAIIAPEEVVATGANKIENYIVKAGTPAQASYVSFDHYYYRALKMFISQDKYDPDSGNTVGYWVALYANGFAPNDTFNATDTNIKFLTYVAKEDQDSNETTFGGLDPTVRYNAKVWAVNADGVINNVNPSTDDELQGTPPEDFGGSGTYYTGVQDKTYAAKLTAKVVALDDTPNATKLTWSNTQTEADKTHHTIVGWQVSYSIDGKNWMLFDEVDGETTESIITGLNLINVKYQFKVQAVVEYMDDTSGISNYFGFDKGVTITSTKANATLAKTNIYKIDPSQGIDYVYVEWEVTAGASVYLVTVQDGKGIVYQEIVSPDTSWFYSDSISTLGRLVTGVKYDVSVTAIAYNGTNVVKAGTSKVSVATAKFSEPTLKIPSGQKAGLTSVEFAVEDKIKDPTDFNSRKYLLEYTYIADAKGKADWSTAEVQHVVDPATNFTLSNLKAGTQYYARLVAYNNSYDSMHSTPEKGTDQTNSDVIVIGKELKFKTVAVPLATLTKPAFALDNYELALKFTGKIPVDKTGNNAVLQNDTKFFYELIVSTDAVIDNVTGKLANGKSVTLIPAVLEDLGTGKNKDEFKTPITQKLTGTGGAFEKLQVGSLDLATFKALNFQLLVYYTTSDAEHAYASAYTKIAKLALPKWFV